MDTILGLLGIAVFMVCVVGAAASVTWAVVKIFPARTPKETEATTAPDSS